MKAVALVVTLGALAACGDNLGKLDYIWDRSAACSGEAVDDLLADLDWGKIDDDLAAAEHYQWAVMFHAHTPGETVRSSTIDRLFTDAEAHHLTTLTFRDLVPTATPQGALVLAFDDNAPDQWFSVRDIFDAHSAHVTFFIARYMYMTPLGHQELAMLGSDGHDFEPHTVNHLHGVDYVAANGIDAYINDEVLPSFVALTDAGFPAASSFAYPFGEHTDEMDTAILQYVDKVRTTQDECPW